MIRLRKKRAGRTRRSRRWMRSAVLHLVLLTGAVVFTLPFAWLITTSLKDEDQTFRFPPEWIPTRQVKVEIDGRLLGLSTMKLDGAPVTVAELADIEDGAKKVRVLRGEREAGRELVVDSASLQKVREFGPKWENYTKALTYLPKETNHGLMYLRNTVYVTFLAVLGCVFSSSLVAYSFARLKWFGRDVLFPIMLSTMMLPPAVTMIPVFMVFRTLGWVDTLRPLWVPFFLGVPFSVFLLRQFFLTIPGDLEDAAKIDGCSYFGIYWRIMLPLVKPALTALAIMTFMSTWNNLMGPLIYINSPEKMTLAYGLQMFLGEHGAEYSLLMAASTLVMLPVLIVFFFTQRYFIQGVTLTGLKG